MSKQTDEHMHYLNMVKEGMSILAQVEVRDALEWAILTLKRLEFLIEVFTDEQV